MMNTRLGIVALHSAQAQSMAPIEVINDDWWQDYQVSQVAMWSGR
jgi:hypothetical protein